MNSTVHNMNDCLSHRGPDADGFFLQEGIALGHRRLAIIDLSEAANQPMFDESGRYVIVFNGEIYNFKEVKAQIKNYPFKTSSDTEVILAAYREWGTAFLNRIKGMFAFALWDQQERELLIARDRFGVKPLYYHFADGVLLFSSEIRSLLKSGRIKAQLDIQSLSDYLKYQSVITPHTLVKGIKQLPAGHYMVLKKNDLRIKQYWDITNKQIDFGDTDVSSIQGKIKELLFRAVEQRLISDVPLGAFLSGGIDSSAIVAIMSQVSSAKPNAFTIAFEEEEYDESPYAELVAKKFNVNHTSVLLKPENFLSELPVALNAMDTPSGDGLNTYVVSKAIRKSGMTVALSGIGGDELFGGYPIFKQFHFLKQKEKIFKGTFPLRNIASHFVPASNQKNERFKNILQLDSPAIDRIYPLLRQIQTNAQIDRLTTINESVVDTLEANLNDYHDRLDQFDSYSQISIADYLGYTQHVLLKDADQMAMASSLEIREPYFDHELVEYVLNIPEEIKMREYPKSLLVNSLGSLLPHEIVHRKKKGFVLPYDVWMRNDIREFCSARIKNLADREFINSTQVEKYWDDFLRGKKNIRWTDMWILIVLEQWLEKNHVN